MKKDYFVAILLIALGIATRLLPHAANVTAIGAIAVIAGRFLPRKLAIATPLIAMVLSDLVIGFYSLPIMVAVYGSLLIVVLLNKNSDSKNRFGSFLFSGAIGTFIFFIVTNFAVWLWSGMYTHTPLGLLESYTMALPFLRNSFIGDIFYVSTLFSIIKLCSIYGKHIVAKIGFAKIAKIA